MRAVGLKTRLWIREKVVLIIQLKFVKRAVFGRGVQAGKVAVRFPLQRKHPIFKHNLDRFALRRPHSESDTFTGKVSQAVSGYSTLGVYIHTRCRWSCMKAFT